MGTDPRLARLHEILAALTERRFAASLTEVERALAAWRGGDLETVAAHEAVVHHVERADGIMRDAMAIAARPDELITAAHAAGVIDDDELTTLTTDPLPSLADEADVIAPARPNKRAVAEALLDKGPVLVHLDARREAVSVPERFRREAKLVLRFGYGLSPPILDLTVDEVGIGGTLVFGGVPFRCVLPWSAIFAVILDGESRGMVWPEDALADSVEAVPEAASDPEPEPDPEPPRRAKRPSHLRLVD